MQAPREADFTRGAYFSCLQRPARKSSGEAPGARSCVGARRAEQASWEAALEEEPAGLQCAFLRRGIPREDVQGLSGIGLHVHHGLPCESVTVSWESEAGTPYWQLQVMKMLPNLSQIPLINTHHTSAEVSCILPSAFCARNNLNRSLGQNQTPDNTTPAHAAPLPAFCGPQHGLQRAPSATLSARDAAAASHRSPAPSRSSPALQPISHFAI